MISEKVNQDAYQNFNKSNSIFGNVPCINPFDEPFPEDKNYSMFLQEIDQKSEFLFIQLSKGRLVNISN